MNDKAEPLPDNPASRLAPSAPRPSKADLRQQLEKRFNCQ